MTADGLETEWPWSDAKTISLTLEELGLLRQPDALARILAHKDLANYQIVRLYSGKMRLQRAMKMQRCARRIVEHRIADLCKDMGEARICDIVSSSNDRWELERLLLEEIHRPRRNIGWAGKVDGE